MLLDNETFQQKAMEERINYERQLKKLLQHDFFLERK